MMSTQKVALITGITGQDGSYLSELLLKKNYVVYGLIRRSSNPNTKRIDHLISCDDYLEERDENCNESGNKIKLIYGDLTCSASLLAAIQQAQPDEIYNLGAQSHVGVSFKNAVYTSDVVALGPMRLLEAVRQAGLADTCRVYQASSSEQFGDALPPQCEKTPFQPRSPYGISKHYAFQTMQNYREGYGMFCTNGILFNHESPRRGIEFVTRKISFNVAQIGLGLKDHMELGNIYSKRDWGHARDYVRGMWLMLQQDKPDDYVLATGVESNIKEFVELAFAEIGETIVWSGKDEDEIGRCKENGKVRVRVNPKLYRATEVGYLLGVSDKARKELGWVPETTLQMMIKEMVESDTAEMKQSARYRRKMMAKEDRKADRRSKRSMRDEGYKAYDKKQKMASK